MSEQPADFTRLPDAVPVDQTVSQQLEEEERYGGPEGTDADGD